MYMVVKSYWSTSSVPRFSHREYFAKIAPFNNIYWSAFRINRVKMLNINKILEYVLKICKIISGSPPGPYRYLSKWAKTGP
jgi:hypothetical protein